jgi:hypothetical protein
MTTFNRFGDRNLDQQDGIERHIWSEQTFTNAGSIIHVKGTDTEDEEAVVVNNGVGMHFPTDTNTEVYLLSSGSDTNQKVAMLTIPRDRQRKWTESTNGIQHLTDPDRALEFNSKRTYLDDDNVATRGGVLEVKGNDVYIRGRLFVSQDIGTAGNFRSPNPPLTPPTAGGTGVTVPDFDK